MQPELPALHNLHRARELMFYCGDENIPSAIAFQGVMG